MIKNSIVYLIKAFKENKALQIGLIAIILIIAVFVALNFDLDEAQAFIEQNKRQAIFIGIGVYFLMGFTFLPASPLTLFIAVLLGPGMAVLIASIGNTLAALLEYQIGSTAGDVFDFETKRAGLPFGLDKLPITSPYLLMAGRLLPLGKRAFSIVCGAYHVPIGKYLWTSVLMYILESSFIAYGGAGLIRLL